MKPKRLRNLGVPDGEPMKAGRQAAVAALQRGYDEKALLAMIRAVVDDPAAHLNDPVFGLLAQRLRESRQSAQSGRVPCRIWGRGFEAEALQQMKNACSLPVAAAGALMPDAHSGYGLPIGGVLAVRNAVIPFAVGMDIACRMRLSVLDLPLAALDEQADRLRGALERETSFGLGASFRKRRAHPVMDEDWGVSALTQRLRDKAWDQLGTSGSGNHFVEFGVLTFARDDLLPAGSYLGLLSHSGSRGTGGEVAQHYSRVAMNQHRELGKDLRQLAWLDMKSQAGQEYWAAMELMGRYAAANHELIHRHIARHLGVAVKLAIENHHNFAWQEELAGEAVIVHRKGATPAHAGALGMIPGSMAAPGYLVRGCGQAESLNSAAHGAGRRMSRKAALKRFNWADVKQYLAERNVVLLSAGLDEAPMAYKDIEEVMAAQQDLVERVARFEPRLVKMAK